MVINNQGGISIPGIGLGKVVDPANNPKTQTRAMTRKIVKQRETVAVPEIPEDFDGIMAPDVPPEKALAVPRPEKNVRSSRLTVVGPVAARTPVIEKIEESILLEDGYYEVTTFAVGTCNICGKPFKSMSDVGGVCCVCGYVLCSTCTTLWICGHCHRPACPSCGRGTSFGGFRCDRCR